MEDQEIVVSGRDRKKCNNEGTGKNTVKVFGRKEATYKLEEHVRG